MKFLAGTFLILIFVSIIAYFTYINGTMFTMLTREARALIDQHSTFGFLYFLQPVLMVAVGVASEHIANWFKKQK